MDYESKIRVIEGFPHEGISFKDISPLLADKDAFKAAVSDMAAQVKEWGADVVIGPESRGFVLGAPVALAAGKGFVMARKAGKLPGETIKKSYTLEYGTATIELPKFAIKKGTKVVLVDDLMATGGTLEALVEVCREEGAEVVGVIALIELTDLKGVEKIDAPFRSFIKYPH
jgi:adenine phosphoribosyltransferase